MFWSKLINRAETVRGTLCSLYLSHLLYGRCVKIFIMNRYISKELHNQQEYYWRIIYRTEAAVVWTITSYFNNRSEVSNRGLDIEKKIECSWNIIQSWVNTNLGNCPFSLLVGCETGKKWNVTPDFSTEEQPFVPYQDGGPVMPAEIRYRLFAFIAIGGSNTISKP